MKQSQIETIVFDLGGVLIDWNPRYLFRKLITDPERMEVFLREVCNQQWNEEQDAGRPFAEAVRELSHRYPEWKDMIDAYYARWPEMLNGPIAGTVEILNRLRVAGRPLYALTNWSAETFPHALNRFDFLQWFDGIVVSGVEKMLKPEARFFQLLLERHRLKPATTLFIDDVEKNVLGARAVGLHGVQFRDPVILERDLIRFGLL
ncbi:MAG: HAD family phosphatase [Bdellovibrionaceae bacterium]|nr:HAD family phosphatase [Pseudobdellovibrionaceae bacterium]